MFKNMIIAAMAAVIALRIPWFAVCDVATKAVIWLNLSICLLFFLLFLEEMYEKWLKYRARVKEIEKRMKNLGQENRRGTA